MTLAVRDRVKLLPLHLVLEPFLVVFRPPVDAAAVYG
jgi:hypothetical protein